jgi:hypothetical protein
VTAMSKARLAAGVVLAGELDKGEKAWHIDHNVLFEVVEARTHWYGMACVKMRNPHGGIQHFGLKVPFRRVAT